MPRKVKKAMKKAVKKDSYWERVKRFFGSGDEKTKKSAGKCVRMTTKKYTERPSPPYPANECPKKSHTGNDGNTWVSTRASNGVYRWVKSK